MATGSPLASRHESGTGADRLWATAAAPSAHTGRKSRLSVATAEVENPPV